MEFKDLTFTQKKEFIKHINDTYTNVDIRQLISNGIHTFEEATSIMEELITETVKQDIEEIEKLIDKSKNIVFKNYNFIIPYDEIVSHILYDTSVSDEYEEIIDNVYVDRYLLE